MSPIIIYSEATTICNNKCHFCAIAKVNETRGRSYITKEVEDKVAEFIKTFPKNSFKMFFHLVGEPLLYKDLEGYISKVLLPNNEVWMSTNGTFLTDERLTSLHQAGLRNVWFSLFGADDREYTEITDTKHFNKVRAHLCNLISRSHEFERIHIVTFSRKIDSELINIIKTKHNITLQEDREVKKWDPGVDSKGKQICISTTGQITYNWRDYNFGNSPGNICCMDSNSIMRKYLEYSV
jgi:molybdenum cofactor biosynthesis enzyme MoaA